MQSDDARDAAAKAAALHRIITKHPEAAVVVLAAVAAGAAGTADIVDRSAPAVGRDTVLDILAALTEAGVIIWAPPQDGGRP